MPALSATTRHHVRAAYLRELASFVQAEDGALDLGADFEGAELADGERLIDGAHFFEVLERAARASGDAGFGWRFGHRLGTRKHGFFGYLTRSSGSLREVFEHDLRYIGTRMSCLSASLHELGSTTRLEIRTETSIGPAWPILADLLLGCLACLGEELLPDVSFADAARALQVDVQPSALHVTLPTELLAVPLQNADPSLKELALRALAAEPAPTRTTAGAVKDLLATTERGLTLEEAARKLAMSARTLRRKLSADGTSFQRLLDQSREARARHYLRATDLTVGEIATRLAFEGTSSFCQGFRRWTGLSPGQYRASRDSHVRKATAPRAFDRGLRGS